MGKKTAYVRTKLPFKTFLGLESIIIYGSFGVVDTYYNRAEISYFGGSNGSDKGRRR